MAFYNTIQAEPDQLEIFAKRADKQEVIILALFLNAPNGLSPWKVFNICRNYGHCFPITSVRRAITDLEKEGKLVKTTGQVMGPYGVKEYVWKTCN